MFVDSYFSLLHCRLMVTDAHELKVNPGVLAMRLEVPLLSLSMLRTQTFLEQFKMSDRASDC